MKFFALIGNHSFVHVKPAIIELFQVFFPLKDAYLGAPNYPKDLYKINQ